MNFNPRFLDVRRNALSTHLDLILLLLLLPSAPPPLFSPSLFATMPFHPPPPPPPTILDPIEPWDMRVIKILTNLQFRMENRAQCMNDPDESIEYS